MKKSSEIKSTFSLKFTVDTLVTFQQVCKSSVSDVCQTYGIIDFCELNYSYTVLEIGRLMADLMCITLAKFKNETVNTTEKLSDPRETKNDVPECCDSDEESRLIVCASSTVLQVNKSVALAGVALCGYLCTGLLNKEEMAVLKASVICSLLQYYILGKPLMNKCTY